MTKTIKQIGFYNDDEEFVAVPHLWDICPCCNGNGTECGYLGSFSSEDMSDAGPDFADDYFSGAYDRQCDGCEGAGKVMYPDYAKMTPAMATAYRLERQIDADMRAEEAAERRFGC